MGQDNLRGKVKPADQNDKFKFTSSNFATNKEKTECKTGKGNQLLNDEILRALGFKENGNVMTLGASSNEVEKDKNGRVVRRKSQGRILTGNDELEQEI